MPSEESYQRRYERVSAELAEAKQQVQAIEMLALNRAYLVDIERAGAKVRFIFTLRGARHIVEMYGTWSESVEELRKALK